MSDPHDALLDRAETEIARLYGENTKLRAALEPFARKFDAESLFMALAHITREDLRRASDALKETNMGNRN